MTKLLIKRGQRHTEGGCHGKIKAERKGYASANQEIPAFEANHQQAARGMAW
jgi:hypothetical protein